MHAFLHKSENRGHVKAGWLESHHSFSFGSWYDPRFMGISALRVINDDIIGAHNGFGTHPHDNMEILTWVLSGQITHKDSMGNSGHIAAGEWQLMSAGTGVSHSEVNQTAEPVHLLQIWIQPNVRNAEPTYQQIALDPKQAPNQWHNIVAPNQDAALFIRQNAEVNAAHLLENQSLEIATKQGINYVHVVEGRVRIGEHIVEAGDALAFSDIAEVIADQDALMIWFDLPNPEAKTAS